jgi:hypothetical protein
MDPEATGDGHQATRGRQGEGCGSLAASLNATSQESAATDRLTANSLPITTNNAAALRASER